MHFRIPSIYVDETIAMEQARKAQYIYVTSRRRQCVFYSKGIYKLCEHVLMLLFAG